MVAQVLPATGASSAPSPSGCPQLARRAVLRGLGAVASAGGASSAVWLLGGCAAGQGGQPRPAALPPTITFISDANTADYTRYWQQFVAWFEAEHAGTKVDVVLPP